MRNEQNSRLIVGPEIFAGHPKPWPSGKTPISALWDHDPPPQSQEERRGKEAPIRRSHKAEERLIIAGSPKGTEWVEEEGILLPWTYDKKAPQLGQMWLESLRMGSWRRNEYNSPWLSPTDAHSEPMLVNGGDRKICPASIMEDAYLGCRNKTGIIMLHHPECFTGLGSDGNVFTTPIQQVEIIDTASRIIMKKTPGQLSQNRLATRR